jgi:hypothetical protein
MKVYRAYGEVTIQVSVDVRAKDSEEAIHTVSVDINEIISNMKEVTVTTVDGKEYILNVNGFHAIWEEVIEKKSKKRTKQKDLQ